MNTNIFFPNDMQPTQKEDETMLNKKILPVLIAISKGWAVGMCIGIILGMGLGVILAKLYGDHSTISNAWLVVLFAAIGITSGSYMGSSMAYSAYKKYNNSNNSANNQI